MTRAIPTGFQRMLGIAVLFLSAVAWADSPADPPSAKALQALDALVQVDFKNTPLPEALETLIGKAKLKAKIDFDPWDRSAKDARVTLKTHRLTLREALDQIISQERGMLGPVNWIAFGETVHVGYRRVVHKGRNVHRVYNIRFLLSRAAMPPEDYVERLSAQIAEEIGEPPCSCCRRGDLSSLRHVNGILYIETEPEDHIKVAAILREQERLASLTVEIEARMGQASGRALDRLFAEHAAGRTTMSPVQAAAFMKALDSTDLATLGVARVMAVNDTRAIARFPLRIPTGVDGEPPAAPKLLDSSAPCGLELHPTLSLDGKTAMLAVRADWPSPPRATEKQAMIKATVSVPIDGAVVLCSPVAGAPDRVWFIVLRPRVAGP